MRKVILDGKYMTGKLDAHTYMQEKLGIKVYKGKNLDALWDALTSCSEELDIKLVNRMKLIGNLGMYGESITELFEESTVANKKIRFTIKE